MSTTVADIYAEVCDVLMEPGGLTLGITTEAQFLDLLGEVFYDFVAQTGLIQFAFTQDLLLGVSNYLVPETMIQVRDCFIDAKFIERSNLAELDCSRYGWKKKAGVPDLWHEDGLPPKTVEVVYTPNYNSRQYPLPVPPPFPVPPNGAYNTFLPGYRALTLVGTSAPAQVTWAAGDNLSPAGNNSIHDSFSQYLVYGILARIFASNSEQRDAQRALYCEARYQEGISLARAIAGEDLLLDQEQGRNSV